MNDRIPTEIKIKLQDYLNDKPVDGFSCLYKRLNERGEVLRFSGYGEISVIIKILRCRNVKERIKNILRLSNGWREWRRHTQLYDNGIPVPIPLHFECLYSLNDCYEIIVIEDLGDATPVGHYLNSVSGKKKKNAIINIENQLLNITEKIIDLGFVDIDNHLRNFLVTDNEKIVRIDFEMTERVYADFLSKTKYIQMMSRLIESHVYALQPDVDRTLEFASKVFEKFSIDDKTQIEINSLVNKRLARQRKTRDSIHSIVLVNS